LIGDVDDDLHIARAAETLGVTPGYLRLLEKQGRIPPARRDRFGDRIYGPFDLALLKSIGVGSRGRLRAIDQILGAAR